jgi:hypothetical protein
VGHDAEKKEQGSLNHHLSQDDDKTICRFVGGVPVLRRAGFEQHGGFDGAGVALSIIWDDG